MASRTALLTIDGKPTHSMLDDRFAANPPVDRLPHLAWFGVYFATDPGDRFWNPEEGPQLDAIENELLRLCGIHSNGWAAYVQRLDTRGLREYYFYFGEGAAMEKVLPQLKSAYPNYRLEFDRIDDLQWAQYRKWLRWVSDNDQSLPRSRIIALITDVREWFLRS